MMSPSRIAAVAVVSAAIATGAVTSSAFGLAGDKTLPQTFGMAAQLCARTAAGTEARHLRPFSATILADCAALQTAFTNAQTTVLAARAPIEAQMAVQRAAITAACPPHKTTPSSCGAANRLHQPILAALQKQRRAVARTYVMTIDAARTVFWNAIHSLPHMHHAVADAPVPIPPK